MFKQLGELAPPERRLTIATGCVENAFFLGHSSPATMSTEATKHAAGRKQGRETRHARGSGPPPQEDSNSA